MTCGGAFADGDRFLVLTCPRPVHSVESLGDDQLYLLSPDGWKTENNMLGVMLSGQKPFGINKAI